MNQTIDLNSIITAALAPIVRDLVQSSLGQLTPPPSHATEDIEDIETSVMMRVNETLDHKIHNALHDSIQEQVKAAVEMYFEETFHDRGREIFSAVVGGKLEEYLEEWVSDKVNQRIDDEVEGEFTRLLDRKIAEAGFEDIVLEVIEKTSFQLSRD